MEIVCTFCGAPLSADAKFCPQCGVAVHGDTSTRATGDAASMPAARPRPAQGSFGEFTQTLLPVVRAPRVVGNLLAAGVAFLISVVVSVLLWVLFTTAFEDQAELLLPPFLDPSEDPIGVVSLLTFVLHQVPLHADDDVHAHAPLLLLLVPLIACMIGLWVARRLIPRWGAGGFLAHTLPFAVCYALLLLVWSMFSAQEWHGGHVCAVLLGGLIAVIGAVLHDRWRAARGVAHQDDATALVDVPNQLTVPEGRRIRRGLRTATRVLAAMVVVASVGMLIVNSVVAIDEGDRTGTNIAAAVLQVVEGGVEAVGWGIGAEGHPISAVDDDGLRAWELDDVMGTTAFVILLITAFSVVLVGGLYSGFAIARSNRARTATEPALLGALTGVVWAFAMLVAQLLVLSRVGDDEELFTLFDGGELFLLSLLVGALLGALGGILAESTEREPAVRQIEPAPVAEAAPRQDQPPESSAHP